MSYANAYPAPYGNPSEQRPWLPAYAALFQALSTTFIGLRLVARVRRNGSGFGMDDAFITLGWVSRKISERVLYRSTDQIERLAEQL